MRTAALLSRAAVLALLVLACNACTLSAKPAAVAASPAVPPSSATASAVPAVPAPTAAASSPDDPYLWLENVDSPAAMAWVRAENEKTLSVLEHDPRYDAFHRQALVIAESKDRIATPDQLAGRLYNFWQDADHVRGIWRATTHLDDDHAEAPHWRTVLDLDRLATAEHANWVWEGAQCDPQRETRCLISLSDGGEDAVTLREFDLGTARFVRGGFQLPKGKVRVAWKDADTLLVARAWVPGEVTVSGYPYVVKELHRGQALAEAKEIFRGAADDGGYGVAPRVLTDARGHRALLIERPVSTFEAEQSIVTPAGVRRLALPMKADTVALYDGQLLVKLRQDWTVDGRTIGAGTLVAVGLAAASATPDALHPTTVLAPTARQSIDAVAGTKTGLVVTALDNVRGRAWVYTRTRDGAWTPAPLRLPDNATVGIADASPHSSRAYLSVAGFLQPSSLWRADTAHATALQVRTLPPQFDAERDAVDQREATSSDGTRIPYFIVHPKEMTLDGSHPTILYAYGGFDVSLSPSYAGVTGKLWLEHGGVYVVANIRGGGEFGPAWHEAGLKTKRQVIYDDFAAVARDLIATKVTSPRHLGIRGGSNGGLLMGVEMTQHPALWSAVDIQVPLLDMLRFEQIAAGTSWVGEYGSVSVPAERTFLAGISPYQALRRGVDYPTALVWTTTKDDRVGPQHARKFAARLSDYGIPYYFYEVTEGGHGAGANLKERAHTSALEFTYFWRQL